jgi:hypothetical protein
LRDWWEAGRLSGDLPRDEHGMWRCLTGERGEMCDPRLDVGEGLAPVIAAGFLIHLSNRLAGLHAAERSELFVHHPLV